MQTMPKELTKSNSDECKRYKKEVHIACVKMYAGNFVREICQAEVDDDSEDFNKSDN